MIRDSILKTKYGDSYIVREYNNGEIVFVLNESLSFILRKYDDEILKKFKRMHDCLNELMDIFENPTIDDVTMPGFELLLQKTNKALERYERFVPEEFREKLCFDKNKLEDLILSIKKEFYNGC